MIMDHFIIMPTADNGMSVCLCAFECLCMYVFVCVCVCVCLWVCLSVNYPSISVNDPP